VKGIVLAGVCDRNPNDEALAGLRDAATKAVIVIRSSRVGSGVPRRNVEIDDDQLGCPSVGGVEPSKSAGAPHAGNDHDIGGERPCNATTPQVLVGIYQGGLRNQAKRKTFLWRMEGEHAKLRTGTPHLLFKG
jgi:hypothetical protein